MSPGTSRRTALRAAGLGGVALLTGCNGLGATETNQPTAESTLTPSSTPTADVPSMIPQPSADCTVASLPDAEYPTLPSSITESAATEFTLAFEKAYAPAELQAEQGAEFSGFDGWDSSIIESTSAGYIVRTWVALDFSEDSSGTATVVGSTDSIGWYYVTDTYAARVSGNGEEELPTAGWEIVACGTE